MNLKEKIKEYTSHFGETARKAKGVTLSDASKIYRGVLERLPDISHLKGVVIVSGVATLLIFILFAQRFGALSNYLPKIAVKGGSYSEGMVGKIVQLNPLFSPINSAEEAAVHLIFSGLTKKDNNRQNVPDLAERWEEADGGKTFTFYLRKDLKWQDGKPLTADDVLYTVGAVQNPDTRSPLMELWKGIETTKTDERTIVFKLTSPYPGFVGNTNLPILPKHLLENTPTKNLITSEFNSNPVGSGPYKFKTLKKVKENTEVELTASDVYYNRQPYISSVSIKTYPDYPSLTRAYTRKEIQGVSKLLISEAQKLNELPNIEAHNLAVPSYDVLYFNLRDGVGKDILFRQAVSLAVSRDNIVKNVYDGQALPQYSPFIPGYPGYDVKLKNTVNLEAAKQKLIEAGYALASDGYMKKGEERASARLVIEDDYLKSKTAEQILEDCKKAGIEILVEKYPLGTFYQDYLRDRNFDIVLVTQNLGANSDIYGFWHSSQVNDPGLNLSGYADRKLDKFLEQARTSADPAVVNEKYQEVGRIISSEALAVYLIWPDYIFGLSKEVSGFLDGRYAEPKDAHFNINEWFVRDKVSY